MNFFQKKKTENYIMVSVTWNTQYLHDLEYILQEQKNLIK